MPRKRKTEEAGEEKPAPQKRGPRKPKSTFIQIVCPKDVAAQLRYVSERNFLDMTEVMCMAMHNYFEVLERTHVIPPMPVQMETRWGANSEEEKVMHAAEKELVFTLRSDLLRFIPKRRGRPRKKNR